MQSNALLSLFIPCCIPSFANHLHLHFHFRNPTAMAALLPPSTSLQPPKIKSCTGLPSLQPNVWQCRSLQKRVTIRLKSKENPFKPLCAGRPHGPEESHQPQQLLPLSPLEAVVHEFYARLNAKKHHRLQELITDDCVFEDKAFSKPFKQKVTFSLLKK